MLLARLNLDKDYPMLMRVSLLVYDPLFRTGDNLRAFNLIR
jgi:hypothetical protein